MAYQCGDNTAARMGRLTMNPLAHLDFIGSLMILLVGFGWAKPVPVDSRNLKNPRVDVMRIAAAGPISNLILAMLAGIVFRVSSSAESLAEPLFILLIFFVQINIFN